MQRREFLIQQREWESRQAREAPVEVPEEEDGERMQIPHQPPSEHEFFASTGSQISTNAMSAQCSTQPHHSQSQQSSQRLPQPLHGFGSNDGRQRWSGQPSGLEIDEEMVDKEVDDILRAEEQELDDLLALQEMAPVRSGGGYHGDNSFVEPTSETGVSDYGSEWSDGGFEQALLGLDVEQPERVGRDESGEDGDGEGMDMT